MTITVTVNGEPRELAEETTVGGLVAALAPAPKGIAVAVNEELVARSRWNATPLGPGDRVEVLNAAQGG
jgi:sulfur carrier protein